ncbi:MAG: HAD family phosphatase [Cytophagales bacterium]|nr:HAD family phosphatase [Armatimonadota bacterium]
MFSPYRLAAVDLDGTLLGPDKSISAANAAAVRRLREAGVQVMLASGRRHENMLRYHRQLGLSGCMVSCNGALVQDAETNEVLHQRLLPAQSAARILEDGHARGMTQNYYHTDGAVYVREKTPWTSVYEGRTGGGVSLAGDLQRFGGQAALKILWIAEPEEITRLQEEMRARYPDLYLTITDPEYLEFMAAGVSKATGLAVVAERIGVSQQETLAFGDGDNDLPMLRWAGCGIAMTDAKPHVRAAADRSAPPGDPETSFARAVAALSDGTQRLSSRTDSPRIGPL